MAEAIQCEANIKSMPVGSSESIQKKPKRRGIGEGKGTIKLIGNH